MQSANAQSVLRSGTIFPSVEIRRVSVALDVSKLAGMDAATLAAMASAAAASDHPSAGLSMRKAPVVQGEPLRLEIEAFLEAVRGRSEPVVTAEDGRVALALALEINLAIAEHARRTGL